tara:strand:- start:15941 stop:17461 length:1521 start_codon:yes stop_codon:yes gene_type:complete
MRLFGLSVFVSLAVVTAVVFVSAKADDSEVETQLDERWWSPGDGRVFPEILDYSNASGQLRIQLTGGEIDTNGHPFFEPYGPAGRACITCHQPSDAMSLSTETIQSRWEATNGQDPLFAAVDGSDCPILPQDDPKSHRLLLERGLFRIERPWPPKPFLDFPERAPDFKIEVVNDPNGCNSGPEFGPDAGKISVYRRPRPAANMKYLLAVGFEYDPKQGLGLPRDPETNVLLSGNLLADGRASTLKDQMNDAAHSHLEFETDFWSDAEAQIEDFLLRVYAAQQVDAVGGSLDDLDAGGGPDLLATSEAGQLGSIGRAVWSEFEAWETMTEAEKTAIGPEATAWRESVARGARIFRDRTFLISDSAGINSPIGFGNPVRNGCAFCHNMRQMGNDVAPGQVDLGTTVLPFADPAPELPLFRITCLDEPHPHYGREFFTQDPGFALSTGKCADVGKITLQSMRGLSARAPFFSNGSSETLQEVVEFYDRRYNIGYSEQEKTDLINLMSAL